MFQGIYRFRAAVAAVWVAAAVMLVALVADNNGASTEPETFLPPGTPNGQAVDAFRKHFPDNTGLSEAVIAFERSDRVLDAGDRQLIERIAGRLQAEARTDKDLAGISIRSPASIPLPQNPLISPDGKAALVKVAVPANFVTMHSARIVDRIQAMLHEANLPAGLSAAVTGSSGFGHDYALAANRSHERTTKVTVTAVILILLVVYRAPLAALIPLLSTTLAAVVTMQTLHLLQHLGMHVGVAERIFVLVLLYGAGVDYALLLLSRYHENLNAAMPPGAAMPAAMRSALPAILAAAATNICGLLMLCSAQYSIFRTTGPAVAVGLVVALLTSMTFAPATASIFGARLFWPTGHAHRPPRFWPWLARIVTGRPKWVLLGVLAFLAAPTIRGAHLTWVYDTLAALGPQYDARRGADMAMRHWPIGEVAPVKILISSPAPMKPEQWRSKAQSLLAALEKLPDVQNVRGVLTPLGSSAAVANRLAQLGDTRRIAEEYLSPDGHAMRMEVVLSDRPFSLQAMSDVRQIRRHLQALARAQGLGEVQITGASAEMIDVRSVTQGDFHRVAALTLGVIFLIVLVLLRSVVLTAIMVAATVLSYVATLGIAYWFFAGILGQGGLDWKVEVFLFVVMVAVGVDYSIFLAARMAQESAGRSVKEAVRHALVQTGPVISSAGVIMAATLGSLGAGHLLLLHQLGFAMAAGMLIDTFIVRPLLLPAAAILTRRLGRPVHLH